MKFNVAPPKQKDKEKNWWEGLPTLAGVESPTVEPEKPLVGPRKELLSQPAEPFSEHTIRAPHPTDMPATDFTFATRKFLTQHKEWTEGNYRDYLKKLGRWITIEAPGEVIVPAMEGFFPKPFYEKVIEPGFPEEVRQYKEERSKAGEVVGTLSGGVARFALLNKVIGVVSGMAATLSPTAQTALQKLPKTKRAIDMALTRVTSAQLDEAVDATMKERAVLLRNTLPSAFGFGIGAHIAPTNVVGWVAPVFTGEYASARLQGAEQGDAFNQALTMTAIMSVFKGVEHFVPKLQLDKDRTTAEKTLGVKANATSDEIKRAYRHAVHTTHKHPDLGGDPEKFMEATKAYRTLSNMAGRTPEQVESDILAEIKDYLRFLRSPEGKGMGLDILRNPPSVWSVTPSPTLTTEPTSPAPTPSVSDTKLAPSIADIADVTTAPPPSLIIPPIVDSAKAMQNKAFKEALEKYNTQGINALTNDEIAILSQGKAEEITTEGLKEVTDGTETANRILETFTGFKHTDFTQLPVEAYQGVKRFITNNILRGTIKYTGLTQEMKREFMKLENAPGLIKEDLVSFFSRAFPHTKEERELLIRHQENPQKYPIPDHLTGSAALVENLINFSRILQESRDMQQSFFPDSFIERNKAEIDELKKSISTLRNRRAIERRQERIAELDKQNETLSQLRYAPHLYVQNTALENKIVRMMSENKFSSTLRDTLTKLRGRKIATIDEAVELGLTPETDAATVLATHFEYLLRKVAIHDAIEGLKQNPEAVLPDGVAPSDWEIVPLKQLNGFRVHPLVSSAMKDITGGKETNWIGRKYDTVNALGKMIFFHNPVILPLWNVFQGTLAKGFRVFEGLLPDAQGFAKNLIKHKNDPWKELVPQAVKEVSSKGELYRDLVLRGVYHTPFHQQMSPAFEETMKVILDRMDKDYPKWRKAVEKMTGRPVSVKSLFVIPELYKANFNLVWGIDRIQRTATAMRYLNKGYDIDTAAELTKTFHADYGIFVPKMKKWLNRLFLVPTYKANMLFRMPGFVANNTIQLANSVRKGEEPTPEQKEAFAALIRGLVLMGGILSFAAYKGYHLREGYRLVKKLDEPEITEDGKIITERVITLPGPLAEIPKALARTKYGADGLYMYLAKIPQMLWGLQRNRRWDGTPYWSEGAGPKYQTREIIIALVKDYFSPADTMTRMTADELDAIDQILSMIGIATYKRGSTEQRILWEIRDAQSKLMNFIQNPSISDSARQEAIEAYEARVESLVEELEDFMSLYEPEQSEEALPKVKFDIKP